MGCDCSMCQNLNNWGVFWMNKVEMKQCHGRKVAIAIRFLVNGRGLQFQCAKVLHETLIKSVLMYGSETMIW